MRKQIKDLQDEKYHLIQNYEEVQELIKDFVGVEKVADTTPYEARYYDHALIDCVDGVIAELWLINDAYCALNSYAYQVI
jgi:hypothetical protein